MAKLNFLSYGNYMNPDAVSNVLKYILRIRENEKRAHELLDYGGIGVPTYAEPNDYIASFLYVQTIFNINKRKGRRLAHETLNFTQTEESFLLNNRAILHELAYSCANTYFIQGHQVVFAIHYDEAKRLHIHFAINAINYITGYKYHISLNDRLKREVLFNNIITDLSNGELINGYPSPFSRVATVKV